jgi:hypothetical protein
LRSGQQVGFVHFQDAVQEIFSVEVLPHRFPDVLEPADELVGSSYALPEEALARTGPAPHQKRPVLPNLPKPKTAYLT